MNRKLKESNKKIIAHSQNWKCSDCLCILPPSYQIDHIIPYCISKDDSHSNLQALCATCHSKKSQRENNRIIQYKKLSATLKKILCWYCLDTIDSTDSKHTCNKIFKDIFLPSKKFTYKNVNELDKYYHIESSFEKLNITNKTITQNNMVEDKTLYIKLTPDTIWVNNYFTDSDKENYTIEKISNAIKTVCKVTKPNLFSNVEITITLHEIMNQDVPDELIDHIDVYLHKSLPANIFEQNKEISYTYII